MTPSSPNAIPNVLGAATRAPLTEADVVLLAKKFPRRRPGDEGDEGRAAYEEMDVQRKETL